MEDCVLNCITESKNTALDVRVLKIAESMTSAGMHGTALALTEIAADIRTTLVEQLDRHRVLMREMRNPAPNELSDIMVTALLAKRTETDLSAEWRDLAPSMDRLPVADQLRVMRVFITRQCVLSAGDHR